MIEMFDFGEGSVPAHRHINPDGSVGGWVAQTAWIGCGAWVSRTAQVYGNALVYGNARVSGEARVSGNAQVRDNAEVFENALVFGNAFVCGSAQVCGNAQVLGPLLIAMRRDGFQFTAFPCADGIWRLTAGCRGPWTIEEGREHWRKTRGGTPLGLETMAILDCFEAQIAARSV